MSNSDSDHRARQTVPDDELGTVAWFDLGKQFGFVALSNGYGDAFLHMSVLKAAGYIWLPRGTTVRVRTEVDGGKRRVTEVVEVDTSTAQPGENEAIRRTPKT
jgi:CspA family cold shock protein